jgi:hypothetical protein
MHRRSVLLGLITAGIFPGATFAQAPTSSQQAIERATRPYIEFAGSNIVAEDATVVRVWFSPTCRYSYEYQNFFENLARSVPPATGMSVEFSPVLNFDVKKGARDGALWAMTYATVRRYYPAYTLNFIKASYVTAQEYNLSPLLIKNVADTLKAARLNPEQVIKTMVDNKVTLQNDLNNYAKLMKQYKITSTPRVTVAGVYETNPEYVDGDPKKFEIVINALISMASGR